MPDGLTIAGFNRREIDFLYDEIVVQNAYLRHGVAVRPGGVVLDVGANVGLFSLMLARRDPSVRLHAFEPVPAIHAALAANAARHFPAATLHAVGLGRAAGSAAVAFYPRCTGWSTRYPDGAATRRDLAAFAARRGTPRGVGASLRRLAGGVLARHWLAARPVTCRFVPLSAVLAAHAIDAVELVKIDVERAELDVLDGIAPADWPRLRQLVLEVHDVGGRVRHVVERLASHGFTVVADQLPGLVGGSLHMVYARREHDQRASLSAQS